MTTLQGHIRKLQASKRDAVGPVVTVDRDSLAALLDWYRASARAISLVQDAATALESVKTGQKAPARDTATRKAPAKTTRTKKPARRPAVRRTTT